VSRGKRQDDKRLIPIWVVVCVIYRQQVKAATAPEVFTVHPLSQQRWYITYISSTDQLDKCPAQPGDERDQFPHAWIGIMRMWRASERASERGVGRAGLSLKHPGEAIILTHSARTPNIHPSLFSGTPP
jgi:hypothetical protein